jgi:hypothetical protein
MRIAMLGRGIALGRLHCNSLARARSQLDFIIGIGMVGRGIALGRYNCNSLARASSIALQLDFIIRIEMLGIALGQLSALEC